ncbi:MAG: hypothetical protein OEZ39_00430 [Gammaproteobacteria bacterium]|nr:hypothetical protein [Gammaproteobacteria bacterium]MDH5650314.1 hypothetical protein [Gammaproteobacteria bacterium]
MVKQIQFYLGCVLILLPGSMLQAAENEANPPMELLEFLGEGQNIDGEYHDPLQMRDWQQSEMAEGQQEEKEHE